MRGAGEFFFGRVSVIGLGRLGKIFGGRVGLGLTHIGKFIFGLWVCSAIGWAPGRPFCILICDTDAHCVEWFRYRDSDALC